jgi:WD40 repeat protein
MTHHTTSSVAPVRLRRPKPRLDTPYEVAAMLTWEAHAGAVTSLAFVPGGGLLSTGVDGVLKHWDSTTGSLHYFWKLAEIAPTADKSNLLRVLADATGCYAAVGLRTEGVRFFDTGDGKEVEHFPLSDTVGLAPAPNGESVFAVGREVRGASRHTSRLFQYAYPPGKVMGVSKSEARSAAIGVNADASQVIVGRERFFWPRGDRGDPLVFYPTGPGSCPFVVAADGDKFFGVLGPRLAVWGFQVGAFRRRIKGHVHHITGLTATPDGRRLWTASLDATVRQWDVETYRCEKCYGLKVGPLGCVAVSPDGLTAAAGSRHNGNIAVWDLD